MSTDINRSPVDRLLAGIEAGTIAGDVFSDDAVLDATVPNWRFSVRGGTAVREQLGGWYADPGQFQALQRTQLPDGEVVEFGHRPLGARGGFDERRGSRCRAARHPYVGEALGTLPSPFRTVPHI